MPAVDWVLLDAAWARFIVVTTVLATFLSGGSVRYGLRAAGRPRWAIRLATLVTWTIALAIPGRVLLLPLETDLERLASRILFLAGVPILAFWAFGLDATRRAIDRRQSRRVMLFAAIQSIHESLPSVETADDRARLEGSLADLDRFVEPATFEYIQLTRSRIVSWLDGGPRAIEREERWRARIAELMDGLRPESWWQADPWSRLGQRIRGWVLPAAPVLAVASGFVLGRSATTGPIALVMPAAILAGYLLTWRWLGSAAPLLASAAAGLAVGAVGRQAAPPTATLLTAAAVDVLLLAWAAFEWRRSRTRPALRPVPPPEDRTPGLPIAG